MTAVGSLSGERAYRVLLRAYPRSLRHAHGEEMVGLVRDRRTLDGEPWWRLRPSIVLDTVRGGTATRWEELMSTHRALVMGGLGALIALAAISDGPRAALPIIGVAALAAAAVWRWRPPAGTAPPPRSWRRWSGSGVLLLAITFGAMQPIDREATAIEWTAMFSAVLGGLFPLATGLVLLADTRGQADTS